MAITRVETSVLWTGSVHTDSIGIAGNETSLEVNLDATCVAARITFECDNGGTPADGDAIDFYLLETTGDPDADASADEFSTAEHAVFLARVDTFTEDPALQTVQLPIPQKGFKIYATGADKDSGKLSQCQRQNAGQSP